MFYTGNAISFQKKTTQENEDLERRLLLSIYQAVKRKQVSVNYLMAVKHETAERDIREKSVFSDEASSLGMLREQFDKKCWNKYVIPCTTKFTLEGVCRKMKPEDFRKNFPDQAQNVERLFKYNAQHFWREIETLAKPASESTASPDDDDVEQKAEDRKDDMEDEEIAMSELQKTDPDYATWMKRKAQEIRAGVLVEWTLGPDDFSKIMKLAENKEMVEKKLVRRANEKKKQGQGSGLSKREVDLVLKGCTPAQKEAYETKIIDLDMSKPKGQGIQTGVVAKVEVQDERDRNSPNPRGIWLINKCRLIDENEFLSEKMWQSDRMEEKGKEQLNKLNKIFDRCSFRAEESKRLRRKVAEQEEKDAGDRYEWGVTNNSEYYKSNHFLNLYL